MLFRSKAARANLEKALALEPGNAVLLVWMAVLESELDANNLDAALARLDDLTRRYPMLSLGFTFKATVYERRKQPKEARAFYEQALKLDSHDAVAANNLAWLLATSFQEPQEGLELARTAHRLDPSNADFADTLGWIHYQMADYKGAMESLGDAVRLRPDDAALRYHLGLAQSRAGRNKEAVSTLKTALILNPRMPEASQVREELVALNILVARGGAR